MVLHAQPFWRPNFFQLKIVGKLPKKLSFQRAVRVLLQCSGLNLLYWCLIATWSMNQQDLFLLTFRPIFLRTIIGGVSAEGSAKKKEIFRILLFLQCYYGHQRSRSFCLQQSWCNAKPPYCIEAIMKFFQLSSEEGLAKTWRNWIFWKTRPAFRRKEDCFHGNTILFGSGIRGTTNWCFLAISCFCNPLEFFSSD